MSGTFRGPATPLGLLLHANFVQSWRKLLALRERSRLLLGVILAFVLGYAWFSFILFFKALKFIQRFPGLDTLLTERLLYLLFAFFFVLLLFSNLIISYTNLFRNRETVFLLTLPIPRETIFRWKLIESTLLASWAFVFLIAPLLAAFGLACGVPWHFYISAVALTALFIVLPSAFGAFATLNLARYMDRRSFQITLLAAGVLFLAAARIWLRPEPITDEIVETRVLTLLDKMLARTRFAQFPLLPSYWISASVLNYVEGALRTSAFFALVLLSNALFFGFIAMTRFGEAFYDASSAVHSRGALVGGWFRRRRGKKIVGTFLSAPLLERFFDLFWFIPPDRRALILKDIRVFWRDTTQWGQTLVLFGLLAGYILNLRHFSEQLTNPFWLNLVSLLNLGACCLNLATLTTRFVYPQFSLEGKRVWIIGMAPLGLVRVIRTKYALTTLASLALTVSLVAVSCNMLRLPWDHTIFFSISVAVMSLTLNGLATGLGVLYPNFKEDNPGKIVSGFGGTFCLVLSFLYILASIVALAFGTPWARSGTQPLHILLASWFTFVLLSVGTGWVPFHLALRRVRAMEL